MSDASSTTDPVAATAAIGSAVHEVHWRDALPWWILFRAAGMAFSPTVILLAACGGLATWAGWEVLASLTGPMATLEIPASSATTVSSRALPNASALLASLPASLADAGQLLAVPFQPAATLSQAAAASVRLLWFVLAWSLFGTAITRHVAVTMIGEDSPGFLGGLRYGVSRWPASFNSVLFVLLGVAVLSIPGVVLGGLMRADWGLAIAGVVWPLVLAGALVLAILVVGLIAGWPLMVAAVGVERGDSFQAISTAFSYLYQRPLAYAFYGLVAVAVFVPALFAAGLFADSTTSLAVWATSFGMGHSRTVGLLDLAATSMSDSTAAVPFGLRAMLFWHDCIETLLGSFAWGYFWASVTAAYMLLRRAVDGTELDEVVLDELPGESAG
ncbi:MAG: hypothetical protein ACO3NZ_12495 [Pirellulales bacterium]